MNNIEVMPSGSKKIDVAHKINNERFPMHVHNNYEIYLSLSDGNKFFVGHKIYDVNKYDVFLFNNTDVHKINTSASDSYERYVVMFSPSLFSSDADTSELLGCFSPKQSGRSHKVSLPPDKIEEFLDILQKMIGCENNGDSHMLLRLRLFLSQLLLLINDVRSAPAPRVFPKESCDDARMNRIAEYIRNNCEYPLSLDMLSKKFYLNKFYLCRLFKLKMGFGINDYIESCRLSNAVSLLRKGLSVSDVSLKTGFGSDTYFISVFKKNLGLSPKKYIKEV